MIALGFRYLARRAVASDGGQRTPEWPPHPGRVFMALAAAHFEAPQPAPEAEREALLWLEAQPSPSVEAAPAGKPRDAVEAYVPANDQTGGIVSRPKSARRFLSLYVGDDPVILRWQDDPPEAVRRALEDLCGRVTRIGHSSSPVQMWLADAGAAHTGWMPVRFTKDGAALRVPSPGTLMHLGEAFRRGARPALSKWQPYARPTETAAGAAQGPFDSELIMLAKRDGAQPLGLDSTLQLTGALRNAAMKLSLQQPPPEWLSGHTVDGEPSTQTHAAFFPLPFVGGERGDGHILGLAIAVPRELSDEELQPVLGGLLFDSDGRDRQIELWCPAEAQMRYWNWTLERETSPFPKVALRAETWTGGAEGAGQWASVTPVVLHHHPKPNRSGDVERILREAFTSAGLDEEIEEMHVGPVSHFCGAGHARALPSYDEGGARLCRYQTHVRVRFRRPVRGPMLVGRGRFRGYGLFRPMQENDR